MVSEQTFRRWLVSNAPTDWLMQTIETSTGAGIPDVFACKDGNCAWLELKATTAPSKCYMRISQWVWFRLFCQRGGKGILLIKRENDRRIDGYKVHELVQSCGPEQCSISGKDITFPSETKPAFSYKLGTGNEMFYKKLEKLLV